ncbi:MAG: radical SAM protein [Deltaproteobacteria bacterium]|nr:radical SAM protein [Deltaproteobacteria bacterium]
MTPSGSTAAPSPRALTLAITSRCALRCRHCLVESGPGAGPGDVPLARCLAVVRELAALGGEEIWLTGGEPMLHAAWGEILAHCGPQRFRTVGLQTSGHLLGEDQVATLRDLSLEGLRVEVSLDGASQRSHDLVRGPGTFRRALDGIHRMARAGMAGRVVVAFTEMRHNLAELPQLLDLADGLGLQGVRSSTLLRGGRAAGGGQVEPPAPEQVQALLARYHGDGAFRALYDELGRAPAIEWWKGRGHRGGEGCLPGERPYLAADGTLYPCALSRAAETAVEGALEGPLSASLAVARGRWGALRARCAGLASPPAACRACPARSSCAGGCPARSGADGGSPLGPEDRCDLRRAVHGWEGPDGVAAAPSRSPFADPPGGFPC